ncbi:MAG: hypothetical protein J5554_10765 [Paludibacteraceae bacterium]|nr:hypothetical protein [Paludibacteraceae bacterium]
MIIEKETKEFLDRYAKFDANGLLVSIEKIDSSLINALDKEFLSLIHDEVVDRRNMYNDANPNRWFDRTISYSKKEWVENAEEFIRQNPILGKNSLYRKLAFDVQKFWNENVQNKEEVELFEFENLIRDKRNVYFDDDENGTYGFRPNDDFYIDLLLGKFEVKAGDRILRCRAVRKNSKLFFLREEMNRSVVINAAQVKGKRIEWVVNGKVEYEVELDPLYKSIYYVYSLHADGISDANMATSEELFSLYRKMVAVDKEKLEVKNIKDYVSRINKELYQKEIPKEFRIGKEGSFRFIPFFKYRFNG